ncbi:MAG: carbonic anhydrase [Desulfobacterales bacterium]|nr:carbonic anhydrase [Desulfobacterales bacterium]
MGQNAHQRLNADEALEKLLAGNKRFVSGKQLHPNQSKKSRKAVVEAQEPMAAILTCADSRVPPVVIFDQGIGDLFVVRVAGNIIDNHTLGSIEYALVHLLTPLVVVMGHSSCGAVSAVAQGAQLDGHMATFVPPIQAAIKNVEDPRDDLVDRAAREVAKMVTARINESEPIIADYVRDGRVKVVAAYYDLESGEVSIL